MLDIIVAIEKYYFLEVLGFRKSVFDGIEVSGARCRRYWVIGICTTR